MRGPLPPGGRQPPQPRGVVPPNAPALSYSNVPPTLFENGVFYNFSGNYTSAGRPIYLHPTMKDDRGQPLGFVPE